MKRGLFLLAAGWVLVAAAQVLAEVSPDPRFRAGPVLASDDFQAGLRQWHSELEKSGRVAAVAGVLDIDVPGGASIWFGARFSGPILITYEATAIKAQGANDRVSDLNCFWMANDSRSPADLWATSRSGKFSDYDQLLCYYVGLGGNMNSTTRFRRYVGQQGNRPLLPDHDLSAKPFLLSANVAQRVALVAAGQVIGYYRDGRRIFAYEDPTPYTSGWFALRTTWSHLQVRHFRVYRLEPVSSAPPP